MKKLALSFMLSFLLLGVSAQVLNTAGVLKKGNFSIGVQPTIIASGGTDFILFGHVGYGLTKGIDLSAKAGFLGGADYFGGDIEFALSKNMSLAGGAHVWGDFGLDATYLITFDIVKNVDLFLGADADFIFADDLDIAFWIPFGVEVNLNKNMAFIMEADIALTDAASHMFGGGITVYF